MIPSQFLTHMYHFQKLYKQCFMAVSKEFQLPQLEIDILLFLYNNPQFNTARDISVMRGFAKSNVSTGVDSLKRKGYLTSRTDENNRRVHRLYLADDKKTQLEALSQCQKHCFHQLLKDFSKDEVQMLIGFFERIDHNIVSAYEKEKENL